MTMHIKLLFLVALACVSFEPIFSMTLDEIIAGSTDSTDAFEILADPQSPEVMVELDMRLTKQQYWALQDLEWVDKASDEPNNSPRKKRSIERKKRKAVKALYYRWTDNIIPYKVANGVFSSRDMQQINAAIDEWETHTCMQFRSARGGDSNYVVFDNGNGCYSYVGMTGGAQTIGLANGCRYKGVVAHEIGHAVGFHHEQNRPDRDNHVIILKQNIPSNLYYNFKKYPWSAVTTLDVPYDYQSVMHYGGRAFSRNGQYTIKTRDPAYQEVIGNRQGLSFNDIKLANMMYKCNSACDQSITCPSNGFVGKDCRCYCPGNPVQVCDGSATSKPVRPTTTKRPETKCADGNENCPGWAKASQNYCETNTYVKTYCKKSCNFCGGVPVTEPPRKVCEDKKEHCAYWKENDYCGDVYENYMRTNCAKTCEYCTLSPEAELGTGDDDGNGAGYSSLGFLTAVMVLVTHLIQKIDLF